MNITTAHSLWLAPLCLALGTGLAWLLYRRQTGKENFPPRLALLMASLRAIAIAVIAFFLLEPMVRLLVREVRKPVVVVLHDGSSSLLEVGDTAALRSTYHKSLEDLSTSLGDAYDVRSFTYGETVREGIDATQGDGITDIGQALREMYDRFSGPDLGAVVLDGDGIQNRGRDPRLDAVRLGVPVFTIALGDTTVRPDLVLKNVEHNRICFLGNAFPLVVRMEARHMKGARTRVVVRHDSREVAAQEVSAAADPWARELAFSLTAEKAGMQRYRVEIVPVEGEHTTANNAQDIYIDVLDDRQKVLLLGAAPHPDLGVLRLALDGLEGYETQLAFASDFAEPIDGFDLVVLHQLPSIRFPVQSLLKRTTEKGIPVLVVLGASTDIAAFNTMAAGVRVDGARPAITDAQATTNAQFSYFTIDPEQARAIERFPPLQVPFGQYVLGRGAVALANQRVGMVRTEYPLIAVSQQEERRTAVICGEGLWRWRIADQQLFGSQERFDRLVHKLVQFLALKVDKKRFRVDHVPVFTENEAVVMQAELYNNAYEAVNESEVGIVLTDEEGKEFPFAFRPSGNAYRLDAGRLPVGHYTWKATTELAGERYSAIGSLDVRALYLEKMNTVADHGLLADIAARTGGRMLGPDSLGSVITAIRGERTIASRSYAQQRFSDLIGLRWIFFALLALLTAEWVLRRRSGAY